MSIPSLNPELKTWQIDIRTNGTENFLPDNLPNVNEIDSWQYYNQTALPSSVPTELDSPTQLLISRNFNASKVTHNESWSTFDMLTRVRPWLDIPGSFVTGDPEDWWTFNEYSYHTDADTKVTERYGALACPEPECTSHDICRLFYQCFFEVLPSTDGIYGEDERNSFAEDQLYTCMEEKGLSGWETLRCGIIILPTTIVLGYQPACPTTDYSRSIVDWESASVDVNLQRFIAGGFDTEFVYWLGQAVDGRPFSQALGGQLTKIANYQCSLESPCEYQYECSQVGSWTAARLGKEVLPSRWGLLALTALRNINRQLSNQYIAIKGALGVLALDTFLISDFFPEANGRFNVLNALTGLGTILSVVSGFVPVIGPGLSAADTVLPAVGSFLSNSLTSKGDPLVGQKEFAPKFRQMYSDYVDALDSAAATLFKGDKVNGTFNIMDMMANGSWADRTSITKLTGLESNLTIEILSRSIDALWKLQIATKYKSGPQSTKYYGDQGVYYTYNFVEDGPERGHVDYPWGGDRLQEKLGINLTWVTEASAKSYRLAKNQSRDPFRMTGQEMTQLLLSTAAKPDSGIELVNQAGRYPGSWTLPVCDASVWGKNWHWDYTREDYKESDKFALVSADIATSEKQRTHPPCLCDPSGLETYAWSNASGLQDFDTFRSRCREALHSGNFKWPEGVETVTYAGSNNYTIRNTIRNLALPPRRKHRLSLCRPQQAGISTDTQLSIAISASDML